LPENFHLDHFSGLAGCCIGSWSEVGSEMGSESVRDSSAVDLIFHFSEVLVHSCLEFLLRVAQVAVSASFAFGLVDDDRFSAVATESANTVDLCSRITVAVAIHEI